jgi:hypothetical protein
MLRVVLAVVLSAALLGLALPVADSARVAHANSQVHTELDHLDTAAAELRATSDPTEPRIEGAHVERTVLLPGPAWGKATIAWLEIPPRADHSGVRWRVAGGTTQRFQLSVPLVAPPDGLTIRESGRHRLRLELQRRETGVVVVVSRAG